MNRREALRRTASITGIAVSSSICVGLLKGCTPSGKPSWPPIFLNNKEIDLVSSIADVILPNTDTPGALDVHVPEFIDLMLRDCFSEEEKASFRENLNVFVVIVKEKFGDVFEDCTENDKAKIVASLEDEDYTLFSQTVKSNFYRIIKQLTLLGFFSSEYAMKNMLDYNPIPGRFEGCIPIDENQKLFASN